MLAMRPRIHPEKDAGDQSGEGKLRRREEVMDHSPGEGRIGLLFTRLCNRSAGCHRCPKAT
jgi:hypothetical protein